MATLLWNRLTGILHQLLGTHDLTKKLMLYGYPRLDTMEHQLANCLLVLAKTTVYKTYMAVHDTLRPSRTYHQMMRLGIQYRLYVEWHHSIWKNDVERFSAFWLYRQILGKIDNGQFFSVISYKEKCMNTEA
jgi:hypothetical protein